jgi:hypothetical protein
MCTPPAGSVFPIGTTVVTCTASDMAGNTADCSFTVTLRGPRLQVERAIIVTWDCGILQGADNVTGPWTDIPGATSPYCVPSSGAHRFYRVRN